MKSVILVVDDQADIRLSTKLVLSNYGFEVCEADSPQQALTLLEETNIDLILLDMNFSADTTSGEEGIDFLKRLQSKGIHLPVVVMTAWSNVELAVNAMRLGASDFIEKPWDNNRLVQIIRQQLKLGGLEQENRRLRQQRADQQSQHPLVWRSAVMKSLFSKLDRLAQSDATILLTGANGTGKSSIARYIHQQSQRAEQSLVSVNMGAIPESLFESEMFGHKKGAFTDAKSERIGRFELAEKGTLFLDEIANIPMPQQAKLLRVLEDGEFEMVGASRSQKADVRLICATNGDIESLIQAGDFRADLYFRLNTLELHIPPLSERRDDILPLAEHFIATHGHKYNRQDLSLSASAVQLLEQYHWPGNVRELGHMIERAVLLADTSEISREDIDIKSLSTQPLQTNQGTDSLPLMTLVDAENQLIKKALKTHQGKVQEAANTLGITASSLYRRMEKYGISKTHVDSV